MANKMAERAIFINRTCAHYALIKEGRQRGLPDTMIASRGRTYPIHKRGQMIGWEAWVPAYVDAGYNVPVMERN
jgi:hypothetical protein